jgi:hypothetical protein
LFVALRLDPARDRSDPADPVDHQEEDACTQRRHPDAGHTKSDLETRCIHMKSLRVTARTVGVSRPLVRGSVPLVGPALTRGSGPRYPN